MQGRQSAVAGFCRVVSVVAIIGVAASLCSPAHAEGRYLVGLRSNARSDTETVTQTGAKMLSTVTGGRTVIVEADSNQVGSLARSSRVAYLEPDMPIAVSATPMIRSGLIPEVGV